jgi:hypothetical protein
VLLIKTSTAVLSLGTRVSRETPSHLPVNFGARFSPKAATPSA